MILGKSLLEAKDSHNFIFNLKIQPSDFSKNPCKKKQAQYRGRRKIKEMNLKSQSSEQSLKKQIYTGTSRNSSVKVNAWGQHPIQDPISLLSPTTFLSTQKETLIVSRLTALAVEEK